MSLLLRCCSLGLFWTPWPCHRSWIHRLDHPSCPSLLLVLFCSLSLGDHRGLWVQLYARARFCPRSRNESVVPAEALSCCRVSLCLLPCLGECPWPLRAPRCCARGCFPCVCSVPGARSRWLRDPTVSTNYSCPLFSVLNQWLINEVTSHFILCI